MTLDEVGACLNACEREGAHLVLDEAFLDFTDAPSAVARKTGGVGTPPASRAYAMLARRMVSTSAAVSCL